MKAMKILLVLWIWFIWIVSLSVLLTVQKAFLNAALNESDFLTFYTVFDTKLFGFTILEICVTIINRS